MALFGEAESVDEEALLFLRIAHRHHHAMETAHGDIGGDFVGRPAFGLVMGVFDEIEFEAGRVGKAQSFLAETLMNCAVLDLVLGEMAAPEFHGAYRHGIAGRLDLAGALAPRQSRLPERKAGHHRADLRMFVGVIKVVDRLLAVEQDSLLDHPLSDHLGEEIDVFLGAGDAAGDMMDSVDACAHRFLPLEFVSALRTAFAMRANHVTDSFPRGSYRP